MMEFEIIRSNLVSQLFSRLETEGLRYAILRNYEKFPYVGRDIDIVMDTRDLGRWREIAVEVAKKEDWDALTECDHFAKSSVRHHNIEVFRFYRFSPPICLQIDLFHGLPLWGIPLLDEQDMLQGRSQDKDRLFTRVNSVSGNLILLQGIYQRVKKRIQKEKIATYRDHIIKFCQDNEESFQDLLYHKFSVFGLQALAALKEGDIHVFARKMRIAKLYFFTRYVVNHPFHSLRNLIARIEDYLRLYVTRQCGFVLKVFVRNDESRNTLKHALKMLNERNLIYRYLYLNTKRRGIKWEEHKVMERTGIVVKEVTPKDAYLVIDGRGDLSDLIHELINILIARHKVLYRR